MGELSHRDLSRFSVNFQIDGPKNIMCVKDYINVKRIIHGEFMIYTFETDHAQEVYRNLTSAIITHNFKVKVYTKKVCS